MTMFYSALERAIAEAPFASAPEQGWRSYLQGLLNAGQIKADELRWTGFDERLAQLGREGQIGRDTLQDAAQMDAVSVEYTQHEGLTPWYFNNENLEPNFYDSEQEAIEGREEALEQLRADIRILEDDGQIRVINHDGEETAAYCMEIRYKDEFSTAMDLYSAEEIEAHVDERIDWLTHNYPEDAPYTVSATEEAISITGASEEEIERYVAGKYWFDEHNDHLVGDIGDARAAAEAAEDELRDKCEDLIGDVDRDCETAVHNGYSGYSAYSFAEADNNRSRINLPYKETLLILTGGVNWGWFGNSHWSDEDVIAHIRYTAFGDGNTLFVEEIQSDWAQRYRFGQKNDMAIAQAPFIDSTEKWLTLALKEVLNEAVRGNYNRIAFIGGEQAAERFGMKKIHVLRWEAGQNGVHTLLGDDEDGRLAERKTMTGLTPFGFEQKLREIIGDKLTAALVASPMTTDRHGDRVRTLSLDEPIHIRGKGMLAFYDHMLPQTLKKLLKKHDPDIVPEKTAQHETGAIQLGFAVSERLREAVKNGQALFSFAPPRNPAAALQQDCTDHDDDRALLRRAFGAAADLITLSGALDRGEGAHIKSGALAGHIVINPAAIRPLHNAHGQEILTRRERLVWVAHHELFHRGAHVVGADTLRRVLHRADGNAFVRMTADAITAERRLHNPGHAPRARLEAVEEALAEIHAARQSGHMDALLARYRPYAPQLPGRLRQGGWQYHVARYAHALKNTVNRLCGRSAAMTDHDVFRLTERIAAHAQSVIARDAPKAGKDTPPMRAFDEALARLAEGSPREAGRLACAALGGNPARLPDVRQILAKHGYALDDKRLQGSAAHPLRLQEALVKAVRRASAPAQTPTRKRTINHDYSR